MLVLEIVGASQLHKVAELPAVHNDDLHFLVGPQYYALPSLWVRGGAGIGNYHAILGGDKGDRTLHGLAGVLGLGLDIFRRKYLVLGFELFTTGTITKDGLMTSWAFCLGVSYY